MKKTISLYIAICLAIQPIQTKESWQDKVYQYAQTAIDHVWNASSQRKAAYAAAGTLVATHMYKKHIAPRLYAIDTVSDDAQVIGKALQDAIDENPYLKGKFYWGISSACSQNESESGTSTISQEYRDQSQEYIDNYLPAHGEWVPLGKGCQSDTEWQDDNQKIADLGCNMYRFSIDWSRIQPNKGEWNQAAIERYKAQIKDLKDRGIEPMICFHHYSDPIWFMNAGGFEGEENANFFTKFSTRCIEEFENLGVRHWLIMNQPFAYINKGYLVGTQPPFKKKILGNPWKEKVKANIFNSHLAICRFVKKRNTAQGTDHKTGISHQITPMKAGRYYDIISPFIGYMADKAYNQAFLNFASEHKNDFDFFALSYYSPCRFTFCDVGVFPPQFEIVNRAGFWGNETKGNETDDPGRIVDARGFYDAIVRVAQAIGKDKPIIFIESGVDVQNEEQRKDYFNKTMSAMLKAIKDGYHVRGFCAWTLMDNYEWGKGYEAHFGLYRNRVLSNGLLKEGGAHYRDIIAAARGE